MRRQTTTLLVLLGALPTYYYRGRECAVSGGGVVLAAAEVADLHEICMPFAARGGCTTIPDWMSANCPASCGSGAAGVALRTAPPPEADAAQFAASGMTDPATPLPAEFIEVCPPDSVTAHAPPSPPPSHTHAHPCHVAPTRRVPRALWVDRLVSSYFS